MYKVVAASRFRSDLAHDAARRYWAEDIAGHALTMPGIRRYLQDHWVDDLDRRGSRALPFHGHSETWYDDAEAYEATVTTAAWRALVDDGANVFDCMTMVNGIVEEHVLRDGPRDGGSVKTMWTVRLREDLDPELARCRWLADHCPLVLKTPGVVRYEQNHASRYVSLRARADRAFGGMFDGFFSVWFASDAALQDALGSEEWARVRRGLSDFAAPGSVRGVRIVEQVKR
jgi:hypothetical protein